MLQEKIAQLLLQSATHNFNGIVTTSYADNYVVTGNSYQVARSVALAKTVTYKFVIDLSLVPVATGIYILPLILNSSATGCHVKTYRITTYTGGTIIPSINMNSFSANTAKSVVKKGIASSNTAGDDLREYELGGSGSPFVTRGGVGSGTSFLIIPGGVKIALEVENYNTTLATFFNVSLNWYEI